MDDVIGAEIVPHGENKEGKMGIMFIGSDDKRTEVVWLDAVGFFRLSQDALAVGKSLMLMDAAKKAQEDVGNDDEQEKIEPKVSEDGVVIDISEMMERERN